MPEQEQKSTTPETPVHISRKSKRIKRAGAKAFTFAAMGLSLAAAFPHSGGAEVSHRSSRNVQIDKDEVLTTKITKNYESPFGKIEIIGNENFVKQTTDTLDLLQSKAPDYFKMVVDNMGVILRVLHGSGMNPWENPPRFFVPIGCSSRAQPGMPETLFMMPTIQDSGTNMQKSIQASPCQTGCILAKQPKGNV